MMKLILIVIQAAGGRAGAGASSRLRRHTEHDLIRTFYVEILDLTSRFIGYVFDERCSLGD